VSWIAGFLWEVIGLLLLLLFIIALLSPLETLGWWSGWSRRHLAGESAEEPADRPATPNATATFVVFLTGILGFESGVAGGREMRLMAEIAGRLPDDVVLIDDVFPYSVSNNPLNGDRLFARLWRWVDKRRRDARSLVNLYNGLIVTRNLFQVAVSADPRYGPLTNVGVAREIARSLLRHGYPPGKGKPIHIVCYSGGGQIAVGAARYLNKELAAPVRIVSLGGVISDDPGIAYVDRLVHLQGTKDVVAPVGFLLYPGRWPLLRHSAWNEALRDGRITVIKPGPMTHFGRSDYFSNKATFDSGTTYAQRIAEMTADVIKAM
jgi:hypothetical protein